MKEHSTNYFNTFIEIAEDSKATQGEIPPEKGDTKTVASMQFEIVSQNPYKYTSDDVFFQVYANKQDLIPAEFAEARKEFFSKGQPCFRATPLTKRYGWGVHSNSEGKIALYSCNSAEYEHFAHDPNIKTVKAMKSNK